VKKGRILIAEKAARQECQGNGERSKERRIVCLKGEAFVQKRACRCKRKVKEEFLACDNWGKEKREMLVY